LQRGLILRRHRRRRRSAGCCDKIKRLHGLKIGP
jgi:hypothetical protein